MFVPRRQEHEIQPKESALRAARTAANPHVRPPPRALGTEVQFSHLLALQRTPDLPDGTTQNKVLVSRRERIRRANSTRELLPLSLSGMTVQSYGMVTTNAGLQSS
jgi:hypothetical protein